MAIETKIFGIPTIETGVAVLFEIYLNRYDFVICTNRYR
jgi:hypothetical protein